MLDNVVFGIRRDEADVLPVEERAAHAHCGKLKEAVGNVRNHNRPNHGSREYGELV